MTAKDRSKIHVTALVDPRAELHEDVEVGPFSVVGPGVRIDSGTRLLSHVVITGKTSLGKRNTVHPFAVLGGAPQIRKDGITETPDEGSGALVIGDDNVFREHTTVNVASASNDARARPPSRPTTIGAKNLFMAGAHVAHDVSVGSHCVVANAVQLAGHVVVEDFVTFGGGCGIAQRVRIGESAFVAGGSMCERDVPRFVIVQGDRARVRALNVVGLERRGIDAASIARLRKAFARLFISRRTGGFAEVLAELDRSDPFVSAFAASLEPREGG